MKVTVVIPVFNVERYLEKCVNSCLELTEVKEVILVEDKSSDSSLEICYKLSHQDSRVKVLQHPDKKNHGRGASRNLGILAATHEYISFLDADDFYLPNRFAHTKIEFSKHPDADGIYEAIGTFAYDDWAKQKHRERMSRLNGHPELTKMQEGINPENLFNEMLLGNKGWFHFNGLTLKRSAFSKCGLLNNSFRWCEDDDFFFRLAYFCRLYSGSDKPVAMRGVYLGNSSLNSNEDDDRTQYLLLFMKSFFQFMLKHPMSKKSAWIITIKYLTHIDHDFIKLPYGLKRKILIRINLIKLLIRYPRLLTKIV